MRVPRLRHLVLVLVACLGLVGGALAFRGAGAGLVVSDPLAPSDAILALDGGSPARELEAADLWHRGLAPVVLVSLARDTLGARTRALSGEAPAQEISARIYRHRGVPDSAIVRLTTVVDNTEQELRAVWEYGRQAGYRRIILVTSPSHTRRARIIWNARYQARLTAIVRPDGYERFDAARWWRSRRSIEVTLHEWGGIAHFLVGSPWPTFDRPAPEPRAGAPTSAVWPPAAWPPPPPRQQAARPAGPPSPAAG